MTQGEVPDSCNPATYVALCLETGRVQQITRTGCLPSMDREEEAGDALSVLKGGL